MLMKLADDHFGANDCGYKAVLTAFHLGEVNHATASLRNEGHIESVGRLWKPAAELHGEDVEIIQKRRRKRVRGELSAGVRMAHRHGDINDAVSLSRALGALDALEKPIEVSNDSPLNQE